jgi:cytochrome c oxidase subunit 3
LAKAYATAESHGTPHSVHHVAHQFETVEQQREASTLGMWTFLITEVMFFGAVFAAFTVYRYLYPGPFSIGSHHLNELFGGVNTAVLLTSSFTMVLAVHAAEEGHRDQLVRYLLITVALAGVFLVIKAFEYYGEYRDELIPLLSNFANRPELGTEPHKVELFMIFYFTMTGLHALHILLGIGLLSTLAFFARRGRYNAAYHTPVELGGLYWHFVDLVWVFLFPLLYLMGAHQ